MKKGFALVALVLFALFVPSVNAQTAQEKIDILQAKVDRLEAKLDAALKGTNAKAQAIWEGHPYAVPPNAISFMPVNSGRSAVSCNENGSCARRGLLGRRR